MPVGGGRLGGEKGVLRLPKRGMVFVMDLGKWSWEGRRGLSGVPSLGAGDCPGMRVAAALMLMGRDVDEMGVQSSKEILRSVRSRGRRVAGQCRFAVMLGQGRL
jgi:hypothetical protein